MPSFSAFGPGEKPTPAPRAMPLAAAPSLAPARPAAVKPAAAQRAVKCGRGGCHGAQ